MGVSVLRVQSVARELERRIIDGEYPLGDRVPPEPQLAREFAVSRTTIRGAVSELQARGLVSREQGRGTFVRGSGQVSVNILLEANLSVTDVIRSAGRTPGTSGLSVEVEFAPDAVLAALRIPSPSRVVVVRRTRTADGIPTADSVDYLLSVPSLPTTGGDYEHSLYDLLERVHHQKVTTGTARIDAALATGATADRLGLTSGAPVLVLSQVHELEGGAPVMYSVVSLRSDVVNLYVHRGRPANGALDESEYGAVP